MQSWLIQHRQQQEPGRIEVRLHVNQQHTSMDYILTQAGQDRKCQLTCLGSRRGPHASWAPRRGAPRPGGSRACCPCPSLRQDHADKPMNKLLVLALHSQTLARCLMGPLALGAALGAAAATPEPTAPITESGAYLPITSGGWILQSPNAFTPEPKKIGNVQLHNTHCSQVAC